MLLLLNDLEPLIESVWKTIEKVCFPHGEQLNVSSGCIGNAQ